MRERVSDRLLQIIEQHAAFANAVDNRRKVIVRQHDCRRLSRNLYSFPFGRVNKMIVFWEFVHGYLPKCLPFPLQYQRLLPIIDKIG
jgi:hypothetical protein